MKYEETKQNRTREREREREGTTAIVCEFRPNRRSSNKRSNLNNTRRYQINRIFNPLTLPSTSSYYYPADCWPIEPLTIPGPTTCSRAAPSLARHCPARPWLVRGPPMAGDVLTFWLELEARSVPNNFNAITESRSRSSHADVVNSRLIWRTFSYSW